VVEQECVYLDPDGLDPEATHLLGRAGPAGGGDLIAYARWNAEDGPEGGHVRLGRIVTAREHRGRGLGRRTVEEALARIADEHPGLPVRMHAQTYLVPFYQELGFTTVGEPFDEDGIPHVAVLRSVGSARPAG
jgi:ElaA protein